MAVTCPVTIANQQVTSRHLFQKKSEVFASGQWLRLRHNMARANEFNRHAAREIRLGHGVDQYRVTAQMVNVCGHAKTLGLRSDEFADTAQQGFAHLAIKRAHAELERG